MNSSDLNINVPASPEVPVRLSLRTVQRIARAISTAPATTDPALKAVLDAAECFTFALGAPESVPNVVALAGALCTLAGACADSAELGPNNVARQGRAAHELSLLASVVLRAAGVSQ